MRKIIIIAVLFLIPLIIQAQTAHTVQYYHSGISAIANFGDIDSTSTYYSDYIDMTPFDGQTVYITCLYTNSAGTADTLTVNLEGVLPPPFNVATPLQMITTTLLFPGSTTTVLSQQAGTLASFFPLARIRVVASSVGSGAVTRAIVGIYSKIVDYVPTAKDLGNVTP